MLKRIELGTDVAMVGVWDPGRIYPDVATQYGDNIDFFEAESEAGRLFFINTASDGGYPSDIYVNERPDAEQLGLYQTLDRVFLIESQSGQLIAGGLEDYGSCNPQITTKQDEFSVEPGRYALRFYELDHEQCATHLEQFVGREDLVYYGSRFDGCTSGCLLFTLVVIMGVVSWVLAALMPWLWFATAGVAVIGVAYIALRQRGLAKDERYQDIAKRVTEHESRFPPFIFVLTTLPPDEDVQGGWYDLH
ncbi:hypothetical protein OT109_18910 [Phycisphaeraceae bacterium D3-23]